MREVRRRTAIIVLRENREWTLADLDAEMQGDGPYAKWLSRITVAELVQPRPGSERVDALKTG